MKGCLIFFALVFALIVFIAVAAYISELSRSSEPLFQETVSTFYPNGQIKVEKTKSYVKKYNTQGQLIAEYGEFDNRQQKCFYAYEGARLVEKKIYSSAGQGNFSDFIIIDSTHYDHTLYFFSDLGFKIEMLFSRQFDAIDNDDSRRLRSWTIEGLKQTYHKDNNDYATSIISLRDTDTLDIKQYVDEIFIRAVKELAPPPAIQ